MNNNYLKLLKLILKNNTLLIVLQINECLNIGLYGKSLEFGAIDNKDKTFSNFVKGKSNFHYTNKIGNRKIELSKALSNVLKAYISYRDKVDLKHDFLFTIRGFTLFS